MATLICDICGTSYSDTETKCPTCQYSRAFEKKAQTDEEEQRERPKVRGGFFSHKNVQKRLEERANQHREEEIIPMEPLNLPEDLLLDTPDETSGSVEEIQVPAFTKEVRGTGEDLSEQEAKMAQRSNRRLNVVLVLASLVFILSLGYIVVQYGVPYLQQMTASQDQGLVMSQSELVFIQATHVSRLSVKGVPAAQVVWISEDPSVATVSDKGLVTAVGPGTTTIRAIYNGLEGTVSVTCKFE